MGAVKINKHLQKGSFLVLLTTFLSCALEPNHFDLPYSINEPMPVARRLVKVESISAVPDQAPPEPNHSIEAIIKNGRVVRKGKVDFVLHSQSVTNTYDAWHKRQGDTKDAFTIMGHGVPGYILDQRSFEMGDPKHEGVPRLSPWQLYNQIKRHPEYEQSSVIVLYVCYAADQYREGDFDNSFAYRLFLECDKPVVAFSGIYNARTGMAEGGPKIYQ